MRMKSKQSIYYRREGMKSVCLILNAVQAELARTSIAARAYEYAESGDPRKEIVADHIRDVAHLIYKAQVDAGIAQNCVDYPEEALLLLGSGLPYAVG